MGQRGEIASRRIFAEDGKKTYFFNLKENRNHDLYLNIVASRKSDEGFKRTSIIVFQEDIVDFADMLDDVVTEIQQNDKIHRSLVSANGRREYTLQHSQRGYPALQLIEERKEAVGKGYRESVFVTLESLNVFYNGFKKILEEMERLQKQTSTAKQNE